MPKMTVRDLDVRGRRVLVRVDYNVPMEDGRITDDSRIRATLPTIEYLQEQRARVVLCTHFGRPNGKVDEDARLAPIAQRLARLVTRTGVVYIRECIGPHAAATVSALPPGGVALLENVRFEPGEEKNDPEFARALASLADVYVNDAFGTAHRAHASTVGVADHVPAVAGLLMERELEMLGMVLDAPKRPLAAVLGGAKVSGKIAVLGNLLDKADLIIIGGGMAATFFKAKGHSVGDSLIEEERVAYAADVLARAGAGSVDLALPEDVVVAREFKADSESRVVAVDRIPDGWRVMDIGPRTVAAFRERLASCGTVVWNGPMGVFEFSEFSNGTRGVAETLAGLDGAVTVVGGGSTSEAVLSLGLADRMTHVSTGGGASLEFLEGHELPGVAALRDREEGAASNP